MLVSSSSSSNNNNNLMPPRLDGRGAFVVLEGIDRSGKTTQCKMLLQRFLQAGLAATGIKFPNRTTATGQIINDYLQSQQNLDDRAIHLLFSANRWEASHDIAKTLYDGKSVICDRYAYSGVAFSSAKVGGVRPVNDKDKENNDDGNQNDESPLQEPLLSLDWCRAPDRGLPAPDCVIFLQLSPAQAEERGGYGEERYEQRDMQIRVRKRFAQLQRLDEESTKQHTSKGPRVPTWYVIDAAQSMEQVHNQIWDAVQTTLSSLSFEEDGLTDQPLVKLWEQGVFTLSEDADSNVIV
ncbi:hypothetical protein ACA910_022586 [Epithemia clementina (nom. ined.)]